MHKLYAVLQNLYKYCVLCCLCRILDPALYKYHGTSVHSNMYIHLIPRLADPYISCTVSQYLSYSIYNYIYNYICYNL